MEISAVIEHVRTSPYSNTNGCYCEYYDLGNGYGAKVWTNEKDRDIIYARQVRAAEYNAAPEVGSKFELACGRDGDSVYGYVTESVVALCYDGSNSSYCSTYCLDRWMGFQEVTERLLLAGLQDTDIHNENYGWLSDGTMVCIDFGSMYDLFNKLEQ